MVAQSTPIPDSPVAAADRGETSTPHTSGSSSETVQYLTRLFTVLSFASIYVLIQARRRRTTALASSRRDGGGEGGGRFTPAEIGATVSLAASLAWLFFILLPIIGFGRRIKVDNDRIRRPGFESRY